MCKYNTIKQHLTGTRHIIHPRITHDFRSPFPLQVCLSGYLNDPSTPPLWVLFASPGPGELQRRNRGGIGKKLWRKCHSSPINCYSSQALGLVVPFCRSFRGESAVHPGFSRSPSQVLEKRVTFWENQCGSWYRFA
jgi:hypothetical protein